MGMTESCKSTFAGLPCDLAFPHKDHKTEVWWPTSEDESHGYQGKHRKDEHAGKERNRDSGQPVQMATPNGEILTGGNGESDRPST